MVKTILYKFCFFAIATLSYLPEATITNTKHFESAFSLPDTEQKFDKKSNEVPVLNINVYVMGRNDISKEVSLSIGENIEFLNQEFENKVQFHFDGLFLDPVQAYLPDLFDNFFESNSNNLDDFFEPFEQQGAINVYIFDTFVREGEEVALSGFTPRLKTGKESYSLNSPTFDRVFISFEGLLDKSTLVHEVGHFLGLYHPWELNDFEKTQNGLHTKQNESENHMSYSHNMHKFTVEQLDIMRLNALKYRGYLCRRIIKTDSRV